MKIKSLIAGAVLVLSSPTVFAQAALLDFSSSMVSFSADFTQTVYDSDSVALQESVGRVELLRPGRFRWTYTEPSKQVIVADGVSLWVYDEDIKQVTVQPQTATLGSAPIGLLSGEKTIESEFIVTELGEEKGLKWFELEPLVKDTDFNAIYIALDGSGINAMELRDNFDQATQIKFTNFKKNATIDSTQFSFTPPESERKVQRRLSVRVLPNLPCLRMTTIKLRRMTRLKPMTLMLLSRRLILIFLPLLKVSRSWNQRRSLTALRCRSRKSDSSSAVVFSVHTSGESCQGFGPVRPIC